MPSLPDLADPMTKRPRGQGGARSRQALFPYPLFFTLYAALVVYFYYALVEPYLAAFDLYAPRLLADSITYGSICVNEANYLDWQTLRDIGPCVGLRLVGYDAGLLSVINAAMIVGAILWLARVYNREWRPLLALTLINPITFLSIFGPNKEVFGLISVTALAIFVRSRSLAALIVCVVAALFTRIPSFVVIATYCVVLGVALPRSKALNRAELHRYHLAILALVLIVSAIAAIFGSDLQYALLGNLTGAEETSQATTLSLSVENLAGIGLYSLLYVFRLILNLYSGISGLSYLGMGDTGFYYNVGVVGSSIAFGVATLFLVFGKRARDLVDNADGWNIILFGVFFTLIICVSPVVQHRYFFPLYVMVLLFLQEPRGGAAQMQRHCIASDPSIGDAATYQS